jgi:hypothetical protein
MVCLQGNAVQMQSSVANLPQDSLLAIYKVHAEAFYRRHSATAVAAKSRIRPQVRGVMTQLTATPWACTSVRTIESVPEQLRDQATNC